MVFCSKCGAELADDVFFCSKCGARTARGEDEGVEPHWRKDLDKALQAASRSLDSGVREARRSLEEVARDLGPELEQAKEGLRDTAEDVGAELRGVAHSRGCGGGAPRSRRETEKAAQEGVYLLSNLWHEER
jgi:hypothetical protein